MDAQRIADITAALRDLLGTHRLVAPYGVVWNEKNKSWDWGKFSIYHDGAIDVDDSHRTWTDVYPDVLDKLHAASQIVRRMNDSALAAAILNAPMTGDDAADYDAMYGRGAAKRDNAAAEESADA